MRKLNQRDWLALSVPAGASILVAYLRSKNADWVTGLIAGGLMLAFSVWIWRRQIIKHPNDTWKARL